MKLDKLIYFCALLNAGIAGYLFRTKDYWAAIILIIVSIIFVGISCKNDLKHIKIKDKKSC